MHNEGIAYDTTRKFYANMEHLSGRHCDYTFSVSGSKRKK